MYNNDVRFTQKLTCNTVYSVLIMNWKAFSFLKKIWTSFKNSGIRSYQNYSS